MIMNNPRIALVDSGIRNISRLSESVVENYIYDKKCQSLIMANSMEDDNGHGTLCASTIIKECPNTEIINIKILDNNGECSLEDIENVLRIIKILNVNIVNLSLALDGNVNTRSLRKICEELKRQNIILVSSVMNGTNKSVPAIYKQCIGVQGCILKSEADIWFNKRKTTQCVVDSTPYFHQIDEEKYILWGKSNSYATARVSGILARELNNNYSFENAIRILENLRTKKYWNRFSLLKSHRMPDIYQYKDICEAGLLSEVEKFVKSYLKNDQVKDIRLLSNEGGLVYSDCYNFLRCLQREFAITIEDYTEVSREVFYSIYSLCYYLEQKINNNGQRN